MIYFQVQFSSFVKSKAISIMEQPKCKSHKKRDRILVSKAHALKQRLITNFEPLNDPRFCMKSYVFNFFRYLWLDSIWQICLLILLNS